MTDTAVATTAAERSPLAAARVSNARKTYGSGDAVVAALDDVTVAFAAGAFTAIMGPSGSGKSTLMHCVAGLDTLTSGQAFVGDTDLATLSDKERTILRRDRLGFVFQAFNLLPTLTAEENICLPADLAGRTLDRGWFDTVVDTLELRDRLGHRPSELSGGQQQRVAVARALVSRPDVVFGDEPTGALDSRTSTELLRFLRTAVDELGQTVVMVTHDPVAASYADRVVFLADGRVVDELLDPSRDSVLEMMSGWVTDAQALLRSLLAHKLRLLLTVVAVTVGVAFVSGTFVLSDTMGKAFDELYAGLTKGTDVEVRAETAYDDVSFQGGRPLDQALVDQVAAVPGVAAAEGGVTGYALVLDEDGDPVQPGGAPTLGSSVTEDDRLAGDFTYRDGVAPSGPHEVALDALTARKAGYEVGDTARIVLEGGPAEFTVTGIVGFGDTDSLAGATLAAFDLPTAQDLLGKSGKVDQIDIVGDGSVSPEELRDRIAQRLPDGVEALTGEQVAEEGSAAVRDGMAIFTKILLVFAGVSLLVGSFVIWNTFNVLVAQRRREIALLRAVGATRRQVPGGIVLEAAVVGLVSAAFGLLGGIGLAVGIRELLAAVGIEVPTTSAAVEPRTVVASFAVGVVVTLVAAVVPALSATRVGPVEALREAQAISTGIGRRRGVAGTLVLGVGLVGMVGCIVSSGHPLLTGLSTLVAFAGLVVCGPLLARGMARVADRGPRGGGWRLAARNIARTPQRAASTALALTIGLTVVSAVAVTAASTKASVADIVSAGNRSDLILQPPGQGAGFSPEVAEVVRQRDDVRTVVEMRYTGARVGGGSSYVAGLGTEGIEDVADLGVRDGSLDDFGPGTMLLGTDQADELGVGAGDDVTVTYPETGEQTYRVAATFERDSIIGTGYVVPLDDFAANVTSRLDVAVLVREVDGADRAAVQDSIAAAMAADYPNVDVKDPGELTEQAQASIDQLLGLVTALLLLAVVVAILGIVNTLVLSVVERTRELGLMRAVGATRRQVRTVVRRESVLMSLLGALAGIALGTVAGIALSRAMVDQGVSTVSVPVGMLVAYVVVAAVVGVLAAIGPARRASRVDVLRAITVE